MIASVRGRVRSVRLDAVVVEVGGVGMLVQATPATLAELRVGAEAELATSLVVREDALTLFGFADPDERDVFEVVQTVSGIGPRLALSMLAVHTPDGLRAAVATQDLTALMKVPGIGRKGAQRIVLELTDRLGRPVEVGELPAPAPAAAPVPAWREQVVEALVGLGWSARQAADAVDAVAPDGDRAATPTASATASATANGTTAGTDAGATPGTGAGGGRPDVAGVLRAALRHLGGAA